LAPTFFGCGGAAASEQLSVDVDRLLRTRSGEVDVNDAGPVVVTVEVGTEMEGKIGLDAMRASDLVILEFVVESEALSAGKLVGDAERFDLFGRGGVADR
jgi:hypothetical protein